MQLKLSSQKQRYSFVLSIKSATRCVMSAGNNAKSQSKVIAADLKLIYGAMTQAKAESALQAFAIKWDKEHPIISQSWQDNWTRLSVFFDYPPEIREVIYTTNAIESVNASLRKVTKTRRSFPNDEAVFKILHLAIHQISKKWTIPIRHWKPAMSQFMIMHGDRISL